MEISVKPVSLLFLTLCMPVCDSHAMDSVVSTSSSIAKKEFSSTASEKLALLVLKKWDKPYEQKDLDAIKEVIEAGANINQPLAIYGSSDMDGLRQYTPLTIAVLVGRHELAKAFIEGGADVNNTQSDRYVAVPHYVDSTMATRAIDWAWDESMCTLLLESGTDVHSKGVLGYTAVHRTVTETHRKKRDAIEMKLYLLMQYGADIREKNEIGQNAIDIITTLITTEARKNNLIGFLKGGKQFTDYCKARMEKSYDDNDTNIVTSIRTQQIYGPWHKARGQRVQPIHKI